MPLFTDSYYLIARNAKKTIKGFIEFTLKLNNHASYCLFLQFCFVFKYLSLIIMRRFKYDLSPWNIVFLFFSSSKLLTNRLPSIAGLNEEFKAYTEKLFYTLAWQRGIQRYSVIVFLISGDKLSTHCCDVCLLYVIQINGARIMNLNKLVTQKQI
jgi:hypothetical protein